MLKTLLSSSYRIKNADQLFESFDVIDLFYEAVEYCLPLMILDTFHVKKYFGVSDEVIEKKLLDWIQVSFFATLGVE